MITTDILVIGAGPAGSIAAKHAALNGANVLLIDRKSEIGAPKRCAEGVSIEGLKKLGIETSPRWAVKDIEGIRLVAPNGTDVWLNDDTIELPEAGYILERKVFDKHMAMDAGRAGAQIKIKTLAKEIIKKEDHYVVICEHLGELIEIKANIIIAADGPESRIARLAGLKTGTKIKDMESGIQFEMCNVEMTNPNVLEFYFGSVAPGGYAWIFPKGEDIANVGLAVIPTDTDKTAYQHLLDFVANCPATQNAQAVELNVGGDPVGGVHKHISGDNILVVGDAAGQVNPLTGGGIISGMTCGKIAGEVAANAIKEENYSSKRLYEYDKLVDDELGEKMKKYSKTRDYLASLSDKELDSIAVAFQDVEFEEVSTTELIKKLVKVSPKALLKLGKLI
ncbi:NAD(P)/FAD-dependent oxidoreductase [Methanobrevibacter filiformis]|uniref:Digeranylgeranylglycerophospholipid reductase n=1 Tax=Methanobrevibacter filiformis TaxID=55758 RepID=A0A166CVD8_9EURY|nr:NAD(P)/FAD-dependent oxidoreductase [Methanobrevibacter filiformis]KZX17087.1 putative oxidoreductasec [Methanobrevibacter filiformis]